MSNLIDVALSGMRVAQKGMLITSNNVANSMDENYSRRQLNLSSAEGGGVRVDSVTHFADRSLQVRQLDALSNFNYGQMWAEMSNDTEDFLALTATGFNDANSNFYSNFSTLASSPNDHEAKIAIFSSLEAMHLSAQSVSEHYTGKKDSTTNLLRTEVETINNLAKGIAETNEQLRGVQSEEQKLTLVNDRNKMLKQLSAITDVRTIELKNGEMDVYIGDGLSLVSRNYHERLSVSQDAQSRSFHIEMNGESITQKMSGGSIDGIISGFNEFVTPAVNKTGQHFFAFTAAMNATYNSWLDDTGGAVGQSPVLPFTTETVSSTVPGIDAAGNGGQVAIKAEVNTNDFPPADLGSLPQEILIKKTSSGYDIINKRTGELIGQPNTLTTPITINGIALSSLPSTMEMQLGETVEIMPFINANSQFEPAFDNALAMDWGNIENTLELSEKITTMGAAHWANNGQSSLQSNAPFFDSELISKAHRVKTALSFDQTNLEQLSAQMTSIQGVSLDEEAANQMRYQELYEVSAQLVKTSQTLFSTLMAALR